MGKGELHDSLAMMGFMCDAQHWNLCVTCREACKIGGIKLGALHNEVVAKGGLMVRATKDSGRRGRWSHDTNGICRLAGAQESWRKIKVEVTLISLQSEASF